MFKLVLGGIVSLSILSSLGCAEVQQTMGDIGKGVSQGYDQATGGKGFIGAISDGVKDGVNGKVPQVLGYINLGNGGYITYFDNNKMGFPSQGSILAAPPKAGTVPPPMVVAPTGKYEGKLLPNNIDEMKKDGLFVPVGTSNNVTSGAISPSEPQKGDLVARTTIDGKPVTIWTPDCKNYYRKDENEPTRKIYPGGTAAVKLEAACVERNYNNTRISVEGR